jgi:hypothetical protein
MSGAEFRQRQAASVATPAETMNGTLSTSHFAKTVIPELPDAVARVRESPDQAAFAEATQRGAAMAQCEASNFAVGQIRQALAALWAG